MGSILSVEILITTHTKHFKEKEYECIELVNNFFLPKISKFGFYEGHYVLGSEKLDIEYYILNDLINNYHKNSYTHKIFEGQFTGYSYKVYEALNRSLLELYKLDNNLNISFGYSAPEISTGGRYLIRHQLFKDEDESVIWVKDTDNEGREIFIEVLEEFSGR